MEKQHLTYFKIENFKRFDSFEMSNLGQFNLIVGDNNVGKTSVLEALLFDENIQKLATHFFLTGFARYGLPLSNSKENITFAQQLDYWAFIFRNIKEPIVIQTQNLLMNIDIKTQNELSDLDKKFIKSVGYNNIPNKWLKLTTNENQKINSEIMGAYFEEGTFIKQSFGNTYLTFTPSNQGYNDDLVELFYSFYNNNKSNRKEVENRLRLFIPKLEELRINKLGGDNEILCVTLNDREGNYPITQYGEGTVKITRLLLEILIAKGARLMLDEVGLGIHFSRLKEYWKIVIQLCSNYNVQLFATTHSLECQQAFVEALEDPEMLEYQKDARNISLIENKSGAVEAITFDFEQFEYALNIGFNTRGGAR